MTIKEKFETMLVSKGLWPQEAKVALERVIANDPSMEGRWDDECEGYPDSLLVSIWMNVRRHAADYLKETKPKHFAIRMLEVD